MKKSKFTEQQIAFALRQAEAGTKVKDIVRQMGGSPNRHSIAGSESSAAWAHRSCASFDCSRKRLGGLRSSWQTSRSTKRCCRRSSKKNYEGRSEAPSHRLHEGQLSSERTSSMPRPAAGSCKLSSAVDSQGSDRSSSEDS